MGLFEKSKKTESDSMYAKITTKEQIEELVEAGELKPVYIMPVIFNGQASEKNTIYVPAKIAIVKEESDKMIEELLMNNVVNNYVCKPSYNGTSLVPDQLEINGIRNGNVIVSQKVNIW